MNQRYDLLAFSLLVISAILVIALAADPKGFHLSAWQNVIAALIAVGAALPAYTAAMQRNHDDRVTRIAEWRRRRRAILLRTQFACLVMAREAEGLEAECLVTPTSFPREDIHLRTSKEFKEAWSDLDVFPGSIAMKLFDLRIAVLNLENATDRLEDGKYTLPATPKSHIAIGDVLVALRSVKAHAGKVQAELSELARRLHDHST